MRGRLVVLILLVGPGILITSSSASVSSPSQTTTSSGSVGIRLVAVPGTLPNDSLARSYVVDRLAPGTRLTRTVQIDNDTDAMVVVSVYPAAASIVRGSFDFAPSHNGNELSSWTSVSSRVLRLGPGNEAFDTLTINVPTNASPGERYAVLWAEVSAVATDVASITLVNRVGVRMCVSVGPGGTPASNFTIGSLTAKRSATGDNLIVAQVHNGGQSPLDLIGNLMLSDGPDGLRAGPFAATLASLLLAGGSEPVTVTLAADLPRGPWRADVTLTSGTLQRSAEATVFFPRNARIKRAPNGIGSPTTFIFAIPLAFLAIMAIAILAVRRRHTRQRT